MNKDCVDIGIIQAFLDGELAHDHSARVSGHIAACDACAVMLAEAENESAIVFPALEREFNTLVPTQRLWNKINDSIVTERESRPFWQKAWAYISLALANPSLAAAASLVIVFGIFAAVWMNRTAAPAEVTPGKEIAKTIPATTFNPAPDKIEPVTPPSTAGVTYERAAFRPDNRRVVATPAVYTASATNSNGYMPGEESYVKTISSLSKTVAEQKDGVMRPSERISYESDMAIVNDTISKMKKEVKRNPKNESAKQVLYSSYQNKIDLLNSVAQKEELVASLR